MTNAFSYQYQHNRAHLQTLWQVDDKNYFESQERFNGTRDAYTSATLEAWGSGCFDNINVRDFPHELTQFISGFVTAFGVQKSSYTDWHNIIQHMFSYLDYTEPYFLLWKESLVTITENHRNALFKHKKSGSTLDPDKIETFVVNRSYNYEQYHSVINFMKSDAVKKILRGELVKSPNVNRYLTKEDVFHKVIQLVYGESKYFVGSIQDIHDSYFEELDYDIKDDGPIARSEIEHARRNDKMVWLLGCLGILVWLRGPEAVPFLIDNHPIWTKLIEVDRSGKLKISEQSGGEVVVDGVCIYSLDELIKYSVHPSTCECCAKPLHCTKLMNLTAIKHPICSCGEPINMNEADIYSARYGHHAPACMAYQAQHPIRSGFICQHCLYTTLSNMPKEVKCGRAICPATNCPHHMGELARVKALTQMRVNQLTHNKKD